MFPARCCYCILCSMLALALAWLLLSGGSPTVYSQEPKAQVSFINEIAPILKENCLACHDAKKKKGKFEMTSFETFRKGGTKDDPVTPGKPRESILIDMLTSNGPERMPPKENGDALPKEKVALIAQWIEEGAKLDQGMDAKADLMRELRVRWQPPEPPLAYKYPFLVNALAFTPDNHKLVVGGFHELLVWDIAEGKLEKRIRTRAERAKAMVFLRDGKLAVAGSRPGQEGDVRIYNIDAPGKDMGGMIFLDGVKDQNVLLKELLQVDDEIMALALSNDGTKLAAGGCDRLVRVWDLATGNLEHSIENHADWVFGVAFSANDKLLITASRDKTAKIWDLAAKGSVFTYADHQDSVYGAGLSKDGKTGYSIGEDGNLRHWQTTESGKQQAAKPKAVSGGKALFKVAYRADDKTPLLAAGGADASVRLYSAEKGAALKTLSGLSDYVFAVAFSSSGELVAGGSNSGEVRVWKVSDGMPVKSFIASPGQWDKK